MTRRRLIDANLIIRHLVQDNERHAKAAALLFAASDRGEIALVIMPVVLAECVFVLESYYKRSRSEIANALAELAGSPGVELEALAVHLDALQRYATSKLHYVDCLIGATAAARNLPVATFDSGFKSFKDIVVELD